MLEAPDSRISGAAGRYIGRFAPSPTGPLHAGSLVAALASWLDARAHGGIWLVRIEDTDHIRCDSASAALILQQLAACGLQPDAPPVFQSTRSAGYQAALQTLVEAGLAYPCGCTRLTIASDQAGNPGVHLTEAVQPGQLGHPGLVYPGTCRHGLNGKPARAWRLNISKAAKASKTAKNAVFSASNQAPDQQTPARAAIDLIANSEPVETHSDAADRPERCVIDWQDRRLGPQSQDIASAVGDFVLKRADGCWAYQLAVVVDDAAQGITHIVRGADLAGNTARQILLQRALGLPLLAYLHTPLVLDNRGAKLSKHSQAPALATDNPKAVMAALQSAALVLDLAVPAALLVSQVQWLDAAVVLWRRQATNPSR